MIRPLSNALALIGILVTGINIAGVIVPLGHAEIDEPGSRLHDQVTLSPNDFVRLAAGTAGPPRDRLEQITHLLHRDCNWNSGHRHRTARMTG